MKKSTLGRTGLAVAVGAVLLGAPLLGTAAWAAEPAAHTSIGQPGGSTRSYNGAGTQTPAKEVAIAPGGTFTEGAIVLLRYDEQLSGIKYRIVMPVPQGAQFVSANQGGVYDAKAGTITWIFDGKTPAEAAPLTQERKDFAATFKAPSGSSTAVPAQTIHNSAIQQMMGGSITDWRTQFTYTYEHQLAAQPGNTTDLGITKQVDKSKAAVGDTVGYTLTVTNHGPTAVPSFTVSDPLPAGIDTWATSTPGASISGGKLTFAGGALAVGASTTINLTGVVRTPGVSIDNVATVTSGVPDSNPYNNTDHVVVDVPDDSGPVPLAGIAGTAIAGALGVTGLLVTRRRRARED